METRFNPLPHSAACLVTNTSINKPTRSAQPPSIPAWLSAQRLENLVAQRTCALEQVIEQLRARQAELETLANHDSLTGLASRRLLKDRYQCAVERAKRNAAPFAVLVVDLDGFKCINDTHGHAAGDAVLVAVARRLTATLRTTDTVARLGGDEFALVVECPNDAFSTEALAAKGQHRHNGGVPCV